MANQRIDQLNAETTPAAADVLPVYSIAGSDTKKITVKNLVQQGAALVDNASIPVAKVNLSGISGTNLTNGTVTAAKFDTSTIPATGGVTVSSSNLQLVAPTSPIVRNAGTGSLEHANSGVTAGTYTKVTVDSKGHVTVGAAVAAADLPIAVAGTVGVMSPGTGLSVTGGGVLNHSSSVTAGTTTGFTYDAQGHITGAVALAGADLPIATSSVRGAVRPGTGLSVDGNGILAVTAATNAVLGGVIAGSDFSVSTGTISLAAQAGIAAGQYTKVTINSKGIATAGTVLSAGDIPNLAASQITSGTLNIDRYGANTITGAKLANYATGKISEAFPTADYISQLYFNPLDRTLYMWDGNVFQPIGVSYGQVVFSGTYDAGTNLITSVTTEGAAIGLTVGGALTAPVTANKSHYVVVDQPGTGTAPAPTIALSPPDMLLSNGTTWVLLDVSDTVTAQLASNIQVSPAGNIASTNVQSALQELDDEKLPLAGGTLTGNLALNTGIAIVYEGATTDNFETTLYVVDPTADRTILLPNVSGTVVTTGDTGTVTSTMLLDGTILNEDINASAAIVDTKLATIATAGKVSNSATTATSANTTSAIVARDASGNFTAGTITAALTGAASSNVLKAGDTMTGVLAVTAGTAALPAITPSGDPNTGIYSPGADQLAISTNGVQRLSVAANGDVAFSNSIDLPNINTFIKGGGHNVVQVDATRTYVYGGTNGVQIRTADNVSSLLDITNAGLVGIGTSSPSSALDVSGAISLGAVALPSAGTARIFSRNTDSNLYIQTGSGNTLNLLDGSQNTMASFGSSTVTLQTGNSPRLSIDSSGRVGIGTTSPGTPLHVKTNSTTGGVRIEAHDFTGIYGLISCRSQGGGTLNINAVQTIGDLSAEIVFNRSTNGSTFSEAMRIDGSNRLLVGTSSSVQVYQGATAFNSEIQVAGSSASLTIARSVGSGNLFLTRNQTVNSGSPLGVVSFNGGDGTNLIQAAQISAEVDGTPGANDMPGRLVFSTTADGASSPTERMRITKEGSSRFFCSAGADGMDVASAEVSGTTRYLFLGAHSATGTGTGTNCYRLYTNGNVQNTNNSYGAISDAKLKENIVDATSQWSDIKNLQVRKYNFKEETGHQTHTQIGIIAQEVELISPGLVNESPDRDAEGNDLGTVTKSVNYSVLYMKAVKALQEAMERIEQLEADVAALKA